MTGKKIGLRSSNWVRQCLTANVDLHGLPIFLGVSNLAKQVHRRECKLCFGMSIHVRRCEHVFSVGVRISASSAFTSCRNTWCWITTEPIPHILCWIVVNRGSSLPMGCSVLTCLTVMLPEQSIHRHFLCATDTVLGAILTHFLAHRRGSACSTATSNAVST